jgi:catechol 2,3-dioxygenase-like lactoylglutathione lyase family enzyme
VRLFHYHLVTSEVRELEARYVGKLGFHLVARHGRVGEASVTVEPGTGWDELDAQGFVLRLSELERGAVNVVLQPGHWRLPRVDHLGVALPDGDFEAVLMRAAGWNLPVQERNNRRTFVSTNAGYRIELHPLSEWVDGLLEAGDELRIAELQLATDKPEAKAVALADILGLLSEGDSVLIGETIVRFVPEGPEGRPELFAERFDRSAAGASHPGRQ